MQSNIDSVRATGAEVLAISTDDLNGPAGLAASQGFEFPILYTSGDPSTPKDYGVFNLHGDGLASASVFLIGTDGSIAWESIGERYTHQVPTSEIMKQINNLGGA